MAVNIPLTFDLNCPVTESGILEIVQHVKPEWKGNVKIEVLSGGFINKSWVCSYQEDEEDGPADGDKLVIRVNPDIATEMPFVNRDYEAKVQEYLSSLQLVPKYCGRFRNGIVYQFANGTNPTWEFLWSDDVLMKLVVDKLYQIHCSEAPKKESYSNTKNDAVFYHFLDEVMASVKEENYPEDIRQRMRQELPPIEELKKEARICCHYKDALYKSYPHVLCHQDLWVANMVYDDKAKTVEFIDWEACDYAPAFTDLASFVLPETPEAIWRKWICLYFERAGWEKKERVMEEWYLGMLHNSSCLHLGCLAWGLWRITLEEDSEKQHTLLDFVIARYQGYTVNMKKGHQDEYRKSLTLVV